MDNGDVKRSSNKCALQIQNAGCGEIVGLLWFYESETNDRKFVDLIYSWGHHGWHNEFFYPVYRKFNCFLDRAKYEIRFCRY